MKKTPIYGSYSRIIVVIALLSVSAGFFLLISIADLFNFTAILDAMCFRFNSSIIGMLLATRMPEIPVWWRYTVIVGLLFFSILDIICTIGILRKVNLFKKVAVVRCLLGCTLGLFVAIFLGMIGNKVFLGSIVEGIVYIVFYGTIIALLLVK